MPAVAEARLHDAKGRLCATASATCLVFDLSGRPGRRAARPAEQAG